MVVFIVNYFETLKLLFKYVDEGEPHKVSTEI